MNDYFLETSASLGKTRLLEIQQFLIERDLHMEDSVDYAALLRNGDGLLVATGALDGNVMKYIAVADEAEGAGAAVRIVSELVTHAWNAGINHLFLYTKPANEAMFASLGFHSVVATDDVLMMEDRKDGLKRYIAALPKAQSGAKRIGAVVVNCNPFTCGHQFLIETAANACDALYVFVVSEDASEFSAQERLLMVQKGTAHIKNVMVCKSEEYLVSRATFPTYFIKDRAQVENVKTDLDIKIFATRIAPALGITVRYVGTEPYCPVTKAYNECMKALLPGFGIDLIEIPRKDGISASEVRRLMHAGEWEKLRALVPGTTYEYIKGNA